MSAPENCYVHGTNKTYFHISIPKNLESIPSKAKKKVATVKKKFHSFQPISFINVL